MIDGLKKENFSLKLRIFYLQERLAQMRPENMESAINEVCISSFIFLFTHSLLVEY